MKLFDGWVVVGVGIVVTCVGVGAMLSLSIVLQPVGSFGIGLGAVAIASTFRPPGALPAALPSPSGAH